LLQANHPVVITNGVFDIFHKGHVQYSHEASQLGQTLILGLNRDASVKMLSKRNDRPYNSERDRAIVLAALASVGLVVYFKEKTPRNLIQEIKPDIYVKGGGCDIEDLEETKLVKSWGGQSKSTLFVSGFSTTILVNRIKKTGLLTSGLFFGFIISTCRCLR